MIICISIPFVGLCIAIFLIVTSADDYFKVSTGRHMCACICFAIVSLSSLIAGGLNLEHIDELKHGFKVEAVQRGAAHWRVDDKGRTFFEWLLEKREESPDNAS